MLVVIGAIVAKPEGRAALLAEAHRHVHQSRTEPGCISHHFHVDGDDPDRIFFFERWTDLAALKTHFAHPGTQQLMAAVREHAAGTEPLTIYEATEVAA